MQIMIFLYKRFSATTPKTNSRDKTFVFVSGVSPTLYYTHAKFERVEVFLKGQARCLKTASHYDLNDTGIGGAKNHGFKKRINI